MATVTTTVNPSLQVEHFNIPSELVLQDTGIPRCRLLFNENFSTTGTGVGDEEDLYINLDLPENYFYRPLQIGITFYTGTVAAMQAWDNHSALVEIRGNYSATTYSHLEPANLLGAGAAASTLDSYGATTTEHMLVLNANMQSLGQILDGRQRGVVTPRYRVRMTSSTASIAAITGNIYASFLQYDIDEGLAYPLYYPGNAFS